MCEYRYECDKYRPDCRLYGSFDENGKPHVKKVMGCENDGCNECRKENN